MNLEGFDYTRQKDDDDVDELPDMAHYGSPSLSHMFSQKDDDDVDELPDMAHYGSPSLSHMSSRSSAFRNNGFSLENGGLKLPPLKKQFSVVMEGAEDGADKEATPNGDSYQHNVKEAENTICMMCKDKFVREGNVDNDLVNFRVFRSGPCTTKDSVTWSTVTSLGSAVEGKHFMKAQGVITFPPGSHMASFNVLIGNDEKWEPIRDFVVRLGDVIEGSAVIGALDHSVCTIVDDDIFPEQIERPASKPMRRSEKNLPSCMHSDIYLTVDEIDDWRLAKSFVYDRWCATYPFSMWGGIWASYRALYSAGLSVVIVVFIDQVLIEPAKCAQGPPCKQDAAAIAGRLTLAAALGLGVLVTKLLNAKTETYIIDDRKGALIRKQLRTWLVTQLLWADEARLSTMRGSHYLNAATNEVDAATDLYESIFPLIEKVVRFFLNFLVICWLVPIAAPAIVILIPVAALIQWYRAVDTSALLVKRQECERQWVSTISDVIESTSTFRGLGACGNVAKVFGDENQEFSKAHLAALHYNTRTRQMIDAFCAFCLFGILMGSAFMTNMGMATPGAIVGLITSFQSSSDNILDVSRLILHMKFCCERLRNVVRILNFPTDAHVLADHEKGMDDVHGMWKKTRQTNFELVETLKTEEHPEEGGAPAGPSILSLDPNFEDGFPKEASKWANHLCVAENTYRCSTRRALIAAIAKSGARTGLRDKITILSGYIRLGGIILLKGPSDSSERTLLQLMSGTKSTQQRENIYVPHFLNYAYVSELPSLFEGSILHNLKATLSKIRQCPERGEVTDEEVWYVASRCGLSNDLIGAPETFSVGRQGRNLSLGDRQAICVARAILTDPDVLMLNKPLDFLSTQRIETTLTVLSDFVHKGGLWGILSEMPSVPVRALGAKSSTSNVSVGDVKIAVAPPFPGHDKAKPWRGKGSKSGTKPVDYLRGNGMRTVVFTLSRYEEQVPSQVTKVFNLQAIDNEKNAEIWHDLEQMKETGKGRERLREMRKQLVGGVASLVAKSLPKEAGKDKDKEKKRRTRSVGQNLSSLGQSRSVGQNLSSLGQSRSVGQNLSSLGQSRDGSVATSTVPSPSTTPGSMEIFRRSGSGEPPTTVNGDVTPLTVLSKLSRDARRSVEREKAASARAARKRTQSFDSINSFFGNRGPYG